jgi:hypothetical protein
LASHSALICDRDSKWTDEFRAILKEAGVRVVMTPVQAPNANAYAERFVRSIREECLDRVIIFGERRLLHVLREFVVHYHEERNHQGLGNALMRQLLKPSRAPEFVHANAWGGCCAPTITRRKREQGFGRYRPSLPLAHLSLKLLPAAQAGVYSGVVHSKRSRASVDRECSCEIISFWVPQSVAT